MSFKGGWKMNNRLSRLQHERDTLLNSWAQKEGNKVKILMKIMELEDKIDAIKKGA